MTPSGSRDVGLGTILGAKEPDTGAARRYVKQLHKNSMKAYAVPSAIATSSLVKLCIGLRLYSGQGAPPMYGDYKALRHWMELTIHAPSR
ncbi:hypothetical protein CONPUDRAFT_106565 [Coniophora puteana RWD-64-598 SS2]|uniref:Alpha-1,3-glucosyltransferase n=1 Tax=Coniophora puteana (strain RWD-64-598) TaxID=741705 RepID=A0A5M3ML16_CONPW|nr:uncharacterized protein CONPUDRAFT_106565 [Coniophora puteana RWD-64-598 SS2]EIW79858.1 hypothetical protein CONPUDRAFT_106565 [Coniophora puteana RWD-64-598 SS2]